MSQRMFVRSSTAVAVMLVMAGCSLAPRYEQPESPVPGAFPSYGQQQESGAAQAAADLGWREMFRDPRLAELIGIALENNRDMRIAVQRVEEARAQYGIAQSDRFPTLGIGGTGQITRYPPDLRAAGPDSPSVSRVYQAGAAMTSFEIDFFGRVRNLSEAAYQQYLATGEAQRTVQINLIAQVAEAYFRQRMAEQLSDLIQKTLRARQATHDLVRARFDAGVASELDVHQSQSQLDTARADHASTLRAREQASNALSLLLGTTPPADLPEAAEFGRDQLVASLPAGLPSELLQRRPDILAAEHALRGANANIGAARAAFFPNISITGLLGFASPQLGGLMGSGNRFWQFSPQVQMPIFSGGVAGNLALAEARKHIAVSEYEKSIQTAFREVADALAGEATYARQVEALKSLEKSAHDALKLAQLRYETGIDSFLQVQTAEVTFYEAQQALLQTGMDALLNRVTLYKALGGGWTENTVLASQGMVNAQENQERQ
ncbi:efflux transporter outer membrane subunit [Paracandidimonas soli]|uniref:Multidrug efflux system outer membrane protein n=1 Tax=Paracandidimonas soli TaxID=1917182 RepID=A0A4R3VDX3_9BURK|nr:efflux transporter outer membrane subunit [Paracandidimonas soli]TCV01809.1 multidrug efflux system outer membrane protein [Paracandidimonas soli]